MSRPTPSVIAGYEQARRFADAHGASVEGIEAERAAARAARVLAYREGDDPWLERARDALTEASRRRALQGACDAALELARLEAVDGRDPERAFTVAYRTVRRFDADAEAACVRRARRMLQDLDGYRPAAAVLAAIDGDPHLHDPSVRPSLAGEGTVEAWARDRAGDATLESITVYGARSDVARVVLHFDGVVAFERGELPAEGDRPRRLYLDLERTTLGRNVRGSHEIDAGGVERIRVATGDAHRVRAVFELREEAAWSLFVLSDPFRVVVDFEVGSIRRAGPRPLRVVVLDPGHGGDDLGAHMNGLDESSLTLDVAQRVATRLETDLPDARIVLTRRNNRAVSLEERVGFANSVEADVFVSIHFNGWEAQLERGGVTTFVLDTSDDSQAVALAARENGTSTVEVTDLQRLLAGLHRDDQSAESRQLAEMVHAGTLEGGRRVLPNLPDRGVKSAMFYVLVGARMPAILLEASFLTQPDENRALATGAYRQALAEGIAAGIVRFARR
jgi:N-acetylmuramoyl-L-alanine amidase